MAAAAPYIVTGIATWALGEIVSGLLAPDPEQPVTDDKPTALSNRGDYLPLLIGRERMGTFMAWAGNRYIIEESSDSGGKGHTGGGVKTDVYFEDGVHYICVGPAYALHGLWRNGEKILDFSTITPQTHPDGSTIEVDFEEDDETLKMGDMTIYWGFVDSSEVDALYAGDSGINSSFPGVVRIVWRNLRLGGVAQWPLIEYDVEVRPYRSGYDSNTSWGSAASIFGSGVGDWLENVFGPSKDDTDLLEFVNGATAGTVVYIRGDETADYQEVYDNNERVDIAGCTEEPRVNGTYRMAAPPTYDSGKIVLALGPENDENLPGILTWNTSGHLSTITGQTRPDGSIGAVEEFHGTIFHDVGGNFGYLTRFVATFKQVGATSSQFTFQMILRDTDNSVDHSVIYSGNEDDGYSITTTNGGTAKITSLGYGWRQIEYIYKVGEGSVPSYSLDALQYKIVADRSGVLSSTPVCYLHDDGDYIEGWYTNTVSVTGATRIELDTYLPHIPTVPFVDGSMIPWKAGFGPKGPNPASALHQLLFAPTPYGAELDDTFFKTDWDGTPSIGAYHTLKQLAIAVDNFEGINSHVLVQRGDTFQSVIDNFLLDLGWMIAWDPAIARYVFRPLRDPNNSNLVGSAPLMEIPTSLITDGAPETINILEDIGPNRLSYTYKDSARNYKSDSVVVAADGQIENEGVQRQDDSRLFVARDRESAERIALRRGQIDIFKPSTFTMNVGSNGRLLYPGRPFIFADSPDIDREDIFRIMEVQHSQTQGGAKITASYDIYSLEELGEGVTENLALTQGPPANDPTPGVEDMAFALVEMPAAIANTGRAFSALRIRANRQIRNADLHVSRDDTSYAFLSRQSHVVTGGTLLELWDSAAEGDVTDGPLITPLGPDFTRSVQTLDSFNFQAGRQVAIINDEWFFLQKVTAEDHGTYRLTGFHGGKYGSTRGSHAIGDTVYICDPSTLPIYTDVLAAPGVPIYMKSAPAAKTRVPLTDVTAVNKTLTGVAGPGAGTIHSGDETDLATVYPATDYEGGTVVLQNSVSSNWEQYYSDGTNWNLIG